MSKQFIKSDTVKIQFTDPLAPENVILAFEWSLDILKEEKLVKEGMNVSITGDSEGRSAGCLITKSEALHLAAWLVSFYADDDDPEEDDEEELDG